MPVGLGVGEEALAHPHKKTVPPLVETWLQSEAAQCVHPATQLARMYR
jgi:hypothetical protein